MNLNKPRAPEAKNLKTPKRVVRYFDQEEYAKALVDGYVRISTLDHVRNMESLRADQDEAKMDYVVDSAVLHSRWGPNKKMQYLQELGFAKHSNANGLFLSNTTIGIAHPNAYVYSTSCVANDKKLARVFGQFQVAIADPLEFARLVTYRLIAERPFNCSARWGHIDYGGRTYSGDEIPPNPAFMSVPALAYEKEYRFLWVPREEFVLEPIVIHVPDIVRLCARIA